MKCYRFFLTVFVLFFTLGALFSQQNSSELLEQKLIADGYTVSKQLLSGSLSAEFPYNIILSLPSTFEYPLHRLFFVISQDNAKAYYAQVLDLLTYLSSRPSSYPVELLFSACDESPHPALPRSLSGIKTYIQHLDTVSYTTAIEVEFSTQTEKDNTIVHIGTKNRVSSLPYIESLLDTFDSFNISYSIKGRFTSLYRMGFVRVSPVMDYSSANPLYSLSTYICDVPPPNIEQGDSNYTLIQIGSRSLIITEYVLMLIIIIVSGFSLFFLCSFSFLVGKTRIFKKEELARTWYLLPVIIGITAVFLHLSQYITIVLIPSWEHTAFTALTIKIAVGIVFLSFVSLAQYLFSFPLTSFIYGYLLLIIVFMNVFIFTTVDISLFIPFSIEYLIVYATRSVKRKSGIIAAAFLMAVPFLPYFLFVDAETRHAIFMTAFKTSFLGNCLFACIAVPFEIMWIRIMVRMKLFGKQKGVTLKQILIELIGTALIVLILSLTISIIRSKTTASVTEAETTIQTDTTSYLTIDYERSFLYNKANTRVTILSSLPVLRYDISIQSQSLLPIYDANYPYDSLSSEGSAIFNLDDYPPNPLTLRFSSPADYDAELILRAYLLQNNVVICESQNIVFVKDK